MRNPNGYGGVVKLSGQRRNPYAVRKTSGLDKRGRPIYAMLGYYPTREEALIALARCNSGPYDVRNAKITFAELYGLWVEKKSQKMSVSSQSSLRSAYRHCKALYPLSYNAIRAFQMQEVVDNCGCGYSTQGAIKSLFFHLDRFALELDLITTTRGSLVTAAAIPETSKQPFTEEEIARLWAIKDVPWADSALAFLYTGFRISELLSLKCGDVDLKQGAITGGVKTKAGKNRVVPIHPRILPFIERRMGGEYLFAYNAKRCSNRQYYAFWGNVMERLGANHTPHEARHTFRSRLDSVGANKVSIDLLMGHKSADVGERVYTHKTIEELRTAVRLLP
jgi:integrase